MNFEALNLANGTLALLAALGASFAGGAIGGMTVGGKALGAELAAMLGAFYGPLAGFTGVAVGLLCVRYLSGGY